MVMADRLEIQLPRPLAAVAAPGPEQSDRREGQARREMRERVDAELAELHSALAALAEAQAKFHDLQENFLREAEQQLLNLSIQIARKVLMQEIQAQRHEVDPIVREALSRIPARMDAVVHLHPDDLARCELACRDQQAPGAGSVRFLADPGVGRGECLVQTSHGTVESSIEGHLGEIAKALTESE